MNAFAARLTAASVMNFKAHATCILKETLDAKMIDKYIDNNLLAAAVWIIYAGRIVYHKVAKEYTGPAETRQLYVRYLRKFSKPFS